MVSFCGEPTFHFSQLAVLSPDYVLEFQEIFLKIAIYWVCTGVSGLSLPDGRLAVEACV